MVARQPPARVNALAALTCRVDNSLDTEPSMYEIIAIIAVVLGIAIAIVLIVAATKPNIFSVQRATTMKAPPEKIFSLINDFHRWGTWSPWENKDPAMKRIFSGAASGTGAIYAWEGNKNVGSGRMEILEASLPSKIVIKLDFIKPFEGHNTAEFTMLPQGDATHVNWVMHGPSPFIGKIMHVFINMDRMVGKDFEIGLANLKRLTET
jgi:Polyketide cyclase / dehydrase and lipid transport